LHGMAYYIFLKSLMSLEEFRKNPHVKIPPKSPCANFQSLGIFKNPIFNSEILFLTFGPANLAAHSAFGPASRWPRYPRRPKPPWTAHLARALVASSRKYVFPCGSRLPSWPPPSRLSAKWGRAVSFVFLSRWPTVATFSHCL
jgi:hypothetical protein